MHMYIDEVAEAYQCWRLQKMFSFVVFSHNFNLQPKLLNEVCIRAHTGLQGENIEFSSLRDGKMTAFSFRQLIYLEFARGRHS